MTKLTKEDLNKIFDLILVLATASFGVWSLLLGNWFEGIVLLILFRISVEIVL